MDFYTINCTLFYLHFKNVILMSRFRFSHFDVSVSIIVMMTASSHRSCQRSIPSMDTLKKTLPFFASHFSPRYSKIHIHFDLFVLHIKICCVNILRKCEQFNLVRL